jgi:DNA-binding transcriptional ArsR family regulator
MRALHRPLAPELETEVAAQFRALAEPSRIRIMNQLFEGELAVSELAARTGLSQANASKHLAVLWRAGWLARRRAGTSIRYALADRRAIALCELMCRRVQEQAESRARKLQARR